MTAEGWLALEADDRVTIAADGSWVPSQAHEDDGGN